MTPRHSGTPQKQQRDSRSSSDDKRLFGTTPGQAVAGLASTIALIAVLLGEWPPPVTLRVFCLILGGMCVAVAVDLRLERRRLTNLPQDTEGHVMVEFGIGYSLVLLLFAGTIGFGHFFYVYNSAQSAVRSAARFASLEAYDLPNGTQPAFSI